MTQNRKTPPETKQLITPFIPSRAAIKMRLIDFDTGSAELEKQHRDWLTGAAAAAKAKSASAGITIHLYGFASRLGDEEKNWTLSLRRMNAVLSFIQTKDKRAYASAKFWIFGENISEGGDQDNDPDWRAVEVHIFINEPSLPPPPPPKGGKPAKSKLPPLPGGPRYQGWDIAFRPVGSVNVFKGATVGVNLFVLRNQDTKEKREYLHFTLGASASIGPFDPLSLASHLNTVVKAFFTVLKGVNEKDFKPVRTPLPLTWSELENSLATVSVVGGKINIFGATVFIINFDAPAVYQYSEQGHPIKKECHLFKIKMPVVSPTAIIGHSLEASIGAGPLWRPRR